MRLDLLAGVRRGARLTSPALILVWLALAVGLLWLQWNMGLAGIESYSGNVTSVSADPKFGTHVTLDSTSIDFFFESLGSEQPPDIRVGDHIDVLTQPSPVGWAVAVQSQRATWVDSYFADQVSPFTPQTWVYHELVRWLVLVVGILAGFLGAVSLVSWITSSQHRLVPAGASTSEPGPLAEASDTLREPAEFRSADGPNTAEPPFSTEGSPPALEAPEPALWIGGVTVIALPILELIAVISALGSCAGIEALDALLIAITVGLAVGGITTLILASRIVAGSPRRATARKLGIVAVVMAVVSLPINGFVVLLSGFCAIG